MRGKFSLGIGERVAIGGLAIVVAFLVAYLLGLVFSLDSAISLALGVVLALPIILFSVKFAMCPVSSACDSVGQFLDTLDPSVLTECASKGNSSGLMEKIHLAAQKITTELHFCRNSLSVLRNPVFLCNLDGRIIQITPAVLELLKKQKSQVIGFTLSQAFFNTSEDWMVKKILTEKGSTDGEEKVTLWDGRSFHLRYFASVVTDDDGEIMGAVASFIDLHTVMEKQAQLECQKEGMLKVGRAVSELAQHVASASEELSAAADEQAGGAQKQKRQTETVATSVEEMSSTVLEVARNASATSEAADDANKSAQVGVDMVDKAVHAINGVSESASELSEMVSQLDSQAEEIGRIIGVITDIADQTNLLALNAAIEAARAGEAGRGFAVVADEVRKLAEKTMAATGEVKGAISTIQERSKMAMRSMSETGRQVTESTKLSHQAGEALEEIMDKIQDMVGRVSHIATAAEQQSAATEEISQSIEEIAQVSAEADEGAGQTASATRDLAELSQKLLSVAQSFTKGGDLEGVGGDSGGGVSGTLLQTTLDYVSENLGTEVTRLVTEEVGESDFSPNKSYPMSVLDSMVQAVRAESGIKPKVFFNNVGRYAVKRLLSQRNSEFISMTLKDMYLNVDNMHVDFGAAQAGLDAPKFTYEDKGDVLFVNYRSKRGLFDLFEGVLHGVAEMKTEDVEITVKPLDSEAARAEIRFS